MREPSVMLTHSPRGWARELHAHLMDHGGATVRGYAVGAEDARSESYDVLVADDITSFLTPRLVDDLRRTGRSVLGVFDPEEGDGVGRRRLVELGVDGVVAGDAGVDALVDALARMAGPFVADDRSLEPLRKELAADPLRRTAARLRAPLFVVAGAGSGAGATEVAIQLARTVRRSRPGVVLVDANDLSPSVSQRLAVPVYPNLRTAIDAHEQRTDGVSATLHRCELLGIEVLPGVPSARGWHELRPDDVLGVIDDLRDSDRTVVADVSSHLDASGPPGARTRFATAGTVVAAATGVVVVGRPTPVGCRRIVEWLADARRAGLDAPVHILVNGHRGGPFTTGEITSELQRFFPVRSLHVAPFDKGVDRAAWQGTVRKRGGFARVVGRLARSLDESMQEAA